MDTRLHLCLLAYCASFVLGSSLFPPSREVLFKYYADVQVGTEFPTRTASQFSLRGLLKVQATDDKAVLQLAEITTSLYNGAVTQSDLDWTSSSPLPVQAAELYHPFTIHLKEDAVIGVSGVDGEGEWSVNIKRALASLMQLETSKLDLPAFVAKENGLYGYCDVEYSVQRQGESYIVQKNLDHSSCKGFPASLWSNIPSIPTFCSSGQDDFLTSSSERIYTLNANKNIISIVAKGGTYSQPQRANGELQYILVNQRLVHESEGSISTPAVPSVGALTNLIYHVPGKDISQGRSPIQQSWLLNNSMTHLVEIGASLEQDPKRNQKDLHHQKVTYLIYFMRFMDKSTLKKFFNELVGTSYQQEGLRKLFLECLPKVGTADATLFIRDLIIEKRISDDVEAAQLISLLPFYIREPSEVLLRECEIISVLSNEYGVSQQRAGVLSFATLVFKTCKHHCTIEAQEIYVRKYLERFTDASDYDHKMLYLGALNNLEDGKVFDYLSGVIKDNPNNHLRFLAVWATMNVAPYHPQQVYNLYWPILANVTEPLEMRVAALTMLLVSKPSFGRLFSLHWLMTNEKEPRLKHFYYTTLLSLANTKDPCYSLMKPFASHVLRLLPPPALRHWTTGNYILDHSSDLRGFGAMTQLFLVGDSSTDMPNVFYLKLSSFGLGIHSNQISIYLKLAGIARAIKEKLVHVDPNSITIPQLAEILSKMKAEPSTSKEDVHVEMIIKSEDRIVSHLHLNHTTLNQVAIALSKMCDMNFKRHYNIQHMDTAVMYERLLPMDLGFPGVMEFLVTSLVSLRGSHSQKVNESRVLTHGELELRRTAHVNENLEFYNPMVDLWQGVERSTTLKMAFPFDGKLNVDPVLKSIKFNIAKKPDLYTGIVTQVHTMVFVWGEDSAKQLQHNCPSCQDVVIATKGDKYKRTQHIFDLDVRDIGIKLQGDLFDCEHHIVLQMLDSALTQQNYHVFPASRPFVKLAHVMDSIFMTAPPGSCGSEIRLMNTENQISELEGSMQLSSIDSKTSLALSLIHKSGDRLLHEWKSNVHCQKDDESYHITLDLMRGAPAVEGSRQLCLDAVIKVPTAPTDKFLIKPSKPVTADISMNWAAVGGQTMCGGEPADRLPFKVRIIAETMLEQELLAQVANTWPFSACKNGNDTFACHQAAHEMATLRKYSVVLNVTQPIDPEMFFFARTSDGQLIVSAEVSPIDPVVYVTLGSDRFRLDNTRYWMDMLLLNTHYPALNQIAMKMGFIKPDL